MSTWCIAFGVCASGGPTFTSATLALVIDGYRTGMIEASDRFQFGTVTVPWLLHHHHHSFFPFPSHHLDNALPSSGTSV
jgi:hypothetical protein